MKVHTLLKKKNEGPHKTSNLTADEQRTKVSIEKLLVYSLD